MTDANIADCDEAPDSTYKLLIDAARSWHRSPRRLYHNYARACAVMVATRQILSEHVTEINGPMRVALLAAAWRDAVCIPGASYNEYMSMRALEHTARRLGYPERDENVMRASILISYARVQNHLLGTVFVSAENAFLSEVLLDSDLRSLSAPWPTFKAHQRHLILESGRAVDATTLAARAKFLHRMLKSRSKIYRTEFARHHWEAQAQANIGRWTALHLEYPFGRSESY